MDIFIHTPFEKQFLFGLTQKNQAISSCIFAKTNQAQPQNNGVNSKLKGRINHWSLVISHIRLDLTTAPYYLNGKIRPSRFSQFSTNRSGFEELKKSSKNYEHLNCIERLFLKTKVVQLKRVDSSKRGYQKSDHYEFLPKAIFVIERRHLYIELQWKKE